MSWIESAIGGAASGLASGLVGLVGGKMNNNATKELAKLQEYYALINAKIAHDYEQENLATTGCQALQQQKSAFGYDVRLAKLNRRLQALSADEDYNRAVKYIDDAQAAYKNALVANGYNPLLALSSSIPSYSGRTNSAVGGSVGIGGLASASTSAAPHNNGTASVQPYNFNGVVSSALDFARVASEIKRNESASLADRSVATKNLETAATESQHRDPKKYEIYSEVARNAASSVGTAVGGVALASKAPQIIKALKVGDANKAVKGVSKVAESVAEKGNSAFLGSRILQAVLPYAVGASGMLGQGAAAYGALKMREKLQESSPNARKIMENDASVRKYGRGMW